MVVVFAVALTSVSACADGGPDGSEADSSSVRSSPITVVSKPGEVADYGESIDQKTLLAKYPNYPDLTGGPCSADASFDVVGDEQKVQHYQFLCAEGIYEPPPRR